MNAITKILLPIALLLGACDAPDAEVEADAELAADAAPAVAGQGKRGGKLAKLDADKDGAISLAEAQGSRLADKFASLDRDADGKLTRDELRAMKQHGPRAGKRGKHGERGGMLAGNLLQRRDADNNGALSLAELEGSRMAGRFAALDRNHDGALAGDELAAIKGRGHGPRDPAARAARVLERRDADDNGSLSAAEVQGSKLADKFAELDTDNDGALGRAELTAMRAGRGKGERGKLFQKRDADNNGRLSAAEVQGSKLADKFAAIDSDRDGALTRDELKAFKVSHGRRGPAAK
jgi:Ca2+-binding EF-hand superfamily protein